MNSGPLLVMCTFPSAEAAMDAASALVTARLAACCQVGAPVRSIYEWKGEVANALEVPLTCKTTSESWPDLFAALTSRHPYEVPEIIAVPITEGLPAYLQWIVANCGPHDSVEKMG